jgi:hypothetical protein
MKSTEIVSSVLIAAVVTAFIFLAIIGAAVVVPELYEAIASYARGFCS